jgi:hypothetical protein
MLILQFWFSLLMFKVTFSGVTQCMPSVGVLYFGLFSPFTYSPFTLLPPTLHFSKVCNTHPHILLLMDFIYLDEAELKNSSNCFKWGEEGAAGERQWGKCKQHAI